MSKSQLTGIAPLEITDTFSVDAFRCHFMRASASGRDGSFGSEDLSARYHQAEFRRPSFGNHARRTVAIVTPLPRVIPRQVSRTSPGPTSASFATGLLREAGMHTQSKHLAHPTEALP
jgi:methionyl-tRNA synthetase